MKKTNQWTVLIFSFFTSLYSQSIGITAGFLSVEPYPISEITYSGDAEQIPRRIFEIAKEKQDTGVFLSGRAAFPISKAFRIVGGYRVAFLNGGADKVEATAPVYYSVMLFSGKIETNYQLHFIDIGLQWHFKPSLFSPYVTINSHFDKMSHLKTKIKNSWTEDEIKYPIPQNHYGASIGFGVEMAVFKNIESSIELSYLSLNCLKKGKDEEFRSAVFFSLLFLYKI